MTDEQTLQEAKELMGWLGRNDRSSLPTPKIVQEAERLGELTDGDQRMRSQYEIFQKLDKLGRSLMAEHYPDSAEV